MAQFQCKSSHGVCSILLLLGIIAALSSAAFGENGSSGETEKETMRMLQTNECNIFQGSWVPDTVSYPLYDSSKCPYIESWFNCKANGRTPNSYLNYRWQPYGCDMEKFNSDYFLTKMMHKRIVFVGDSIIRTMYESMLCLLSSGVGSGKARPRVEERSGRSIKNNGRFYQFHFPQYNVSMDFHWSAFITKIEYAPFTARQLSALPPDPDRKVYVETRKIGEWADYVLGVKVDMLVMDTGPWWSNYFFLNFGYRYYSYGPGHEVRPTSAKNALRAALAMFYETAQQPRYRRLSTIPLYFLQLPYGHYLERPGEYKYVNLSSPAWTGNGGCEWPRAPIASAAELPPRDPRIDILNEGMSRFPNARIMHTSSMSITRADAHPSFFRTHRPPTAPRATAAVAATSQRQAAEDTRRQTAEDGTSVEVEVASAAGGEALGTAVGKGEEGARRHGGAVNGLKVRASSAAPAGGDDAREIVAQSKVVGKSSLKFQDCGHFCIAGVPDAWNEALFTMMIRQLK